jgi:hypothetical protein
VPFQLGYRPKTRRPRQKSGPSEIESELGNLTNDQTNPEGRARLTRRLIMDLVCIVIFKTEYSMPSAPIHVNDALATAPTLAWGNFHQRRNLVFVLQESVSVSVPFGLCSIELVVQGFKQWN